jgi:hypothetical protein
MAIKRIVTGGTFVLASAAAMIFAISGEPLVVLTPAESEAVRSSNPCSVNSVDFLFSVRG